MSECSWLYFTLMNGWNQVSMVCVPKTVWKARIALCPKQVYIVYVKPKVYTRLYDLKWYLYMSYYQGWAKVIKLWTFSSKVHMEFHIVRSKFILKTQSSKFKKKVQVLFFFWGVKFVQVQVQWTLNFFVKKVQKINSSKKSS